MNQPKRISAEWNINSAACALLLVDVQEKLLPVVHDAESVERNNRILLQAFRHFQRPVIISEQYPRGLGHTVDSLRQLADGLPIYEKTRFSAAEALAECPAPTIVLSGIETHICVRQTALDLLAQGKQVVLAADAVSSRRPQHHQWALAELRDYGALVMSVESLLFEWLADARHVHFKAVSQWIK